MRHGAASAGASRGGDAPDADPSGRFRRRRRPDNDLYTGTGGDEARVYAEGARDAAARDADAAAGWRATAPPPEYAHDDGLRLLERLVLLSADRDLDLPTAPGAPPRARATPTRADAEAVLGGLRPTLAPALGVTSDAEWAAITRHAVDDALAAVAAAAPPDAAADAAAVAAAAEGATGAAAEATRDAVAALNSNPHWSTDQKVLFVRRLVKTLQQSV